jgi:hypothetical protein
MAKIKTVSQSRVSQARVNTRFQATPLAKTPKAGPMVSAGFFAPNETAEGQAMVNFGSKLMQTGDYFFRKQKQKEANDLQMEFSEHTARMAELESTLSQNPYEGIKDDIIKQHDSFEEEFLGKIQDKDLSKAYKSKSAVLRSNLNARAVVHESKGVAIAAQDQLSLLEKNANVAIAADPGNASSYIGSFLNEIQQFGISNQQYVNDLEKFTPKILGEMYKGAINQNLVKDNHTGAQRLLDEAVNGKLADISSNQVALIQKNIVNGELNKQISDIKVAEDKLVSNVKNTPGINLYTPEQLQSYWLQSKEGRSIVTPYLEAMNKVESGATLNSADEYAIEAFNRFKKATQVQAAKIENMKVPERVVAANKPKVDAIRQLMQSMDKLNGRGQIAAQGEIRKNIRDLAQDVEGSGSVSDLMTEIIHPLFQLPKGSKPSEKIDLLERTMQAIPPEYSRDFQLSLNKNDLWEYHQISAGNGDMLRNLLSSPDINTAEYLKTDNDSINSLNNDLSKFKGSKLYKSFLSNMGQDYADKMHDSMVKIHMSLSNGEEIDNPFSDLENDLVNKGGYSRQFAKAYSLMIGNLKFVPEFNSSGEIIRQTMFTGKNDLSAAEFNEITHDSGKVLKTISDILFSHQIDGERIVRSDGKTFKSDIVPIKGVARFFADENIRAAIQSVNELDLEKSVISLPYNDQLLVQKEVWDKKNIKEQLEFIDKDSIKTGWSLNPNTNEWEHVIRSFQLKDSRTGNKTVAFETGFPIKVKDESGMPRKLSIPMEVLVEAHREQKNLIANEVSNLVEDFSGILEGFGELLSNPKQSVENLMTTYQIFR